MTQDVWDLLLMFGVFGPQLDRENYATVFPKDAIFVVAEKVKVN